MSLYKATSMYDPTDAYFNRYDEQRSQNRAERERFDEAVARAVAALRKNDGDIWEQHLREARERALEATEKLARLSGAVGDIIARMERNFFSAPLAQALRQALEDSK